MPNWKKVAVSGSNVAFHHITASGHVSGTAASSASFGTINVIGFEGASSNLTDFSASISSRLQSSEGDITGVTAGTGLSGGGDSGAVTLNVDFSDSTFQNQVSGSFVVASSSLASRITTTEAELGNTLISSSAQLATAISGSWIGTVSSSAQLVTATSNHILSSSTQLEGSGELISRSIQLTTDGNDTLISSSAQLASAISGSWIGAVSSSVQLSTDISGSWQGWASSSAEHTFGGDIRVAGNVLAENYIVSSSVTHMTQSFSSGSTIFGDSPDDTHIFTGSLTVSGSTGIDVQHGNISGSLISTGSFGRIEASVLSGLSPIRIESDTFEVDEKGTVSGSGESTGSFGRIQADMIAGEVQVTTGSLTGEMWITTNTGSRMFIGKSTKGILVSNDSGSDIDVGQTVDGTDIGFSTVHSTDSSSIYLTTGDGIVIDEQNHWYTDRKFHIGGDSQFIRFDGENNISMSAQMFPQTGSFGGQMWVNTSDTDRMYIGKYAGGFTVSGDDDPVNISRFATDEYGNTIDVGFYINDSGSIVGISDGDGLKVNNYNYWYTNRQYAIGTSSQYIRYDDDDLFQVKLGNAVFASITSSGNISSSATGSFGRIEATTISASTISVNAATLNVGNQTINQTVAGNIQNVSPAAISGSWIGAVSASAQLVTAGTNAILSSSAQLASAISGSWRGELDSGSVKFVGGGVSGSSVSTGSFGAGYIDNKLGIGTTSPTYDVDVLKSVSGGTVALRVMNSNTGANSAAMLYLGAFGASGTGDPYIYFNDDSNDWALGVDKSDSSKFKLSDYSSIGSNDRLVIDTSGKVGIGTSVPTKTLTVAGGISGSEHIYLKDDNGIFWGPGSQAGIQGNSGGTDYLKFVTSNVVKMTLDASGNLGIGTASPSRKLHVQGDALVTGTLTAQEFHTEFVSASVIFESGSTQFGDTGDDIHSFSGSLHVSSSASNENYIIGANVGIGLTDPVQPLHVVTPNNGGIEIDAAAGAPSLILDIPGNEQGRIYYQENDALLGGIVYETTGTDYISFRAHSNVERLRITGDNKISGSAASTGSFGKVFANNTVQIGNIPSTVGTGDSQLILDKASGGNAQIIFTRSEGTSQDWKIYTDADEGLFIEGVRAGEDLTIKPVPTGGSATELIKFTANGAKISGSAVSTGSFGDGRFAGKVGLGCVPANTNGANNGVDIKYNTYAMWQTHGGSTNERAWGLKNSYADAGKFALVSSNADDNVLDTPVTTWDKDGNVTIGNASRKTSLTIDGLGSGWTGADIIFQTGHANRGGGMFIYNTDTDHEWYWGTPYQASNVMHLCYESTGTFTQQTAETVHSVFSVNSSGNATFGGTIKLGDGTKIHGDSTTLGYAQFGTSTGAKIGYDGGNGATYFFCANGNVDIGAGGGSALAIDSSKNATFAGNISGSAVSTGSFGSLGVNTTGGSSNTNALHIKSKGTSTYPFYVEASDGSNLGGLFEGGSGNGYFYVRDESGTAQVVLNTITDSSFLGGGVTTVGDYISTKANGVISGSSTSTGSFGRVEAAAFAGDGAGLTNVPDYVFEPDYNLKTLNELETFVSQSKHLPNVPSIDDMPEWASYTVGDRDMLLLEKIEELTLYIIELHKRVESLESQLPTNNPTT